MSDNALTRLIRELASQGDNYGVIARAVGVIDEDEGREVVDEIKAAIAEFGGGITWGPVLAHSGEPDYQTGYDRRGRSWIRERGEDSWGHAQWGDPVLEAGEEAVDERDLEERLADAICLEDLLDAMRYDRDWEGDFDFSSLPTYGGEAIQDTEGVWSWDATRVLVSAPPGGDLQIMTRAEWAEIVGARSSQP
jgi:hypothetical protein